jgi:hypothetical protein
MSNYFQARDALLKAIPPDDISSSHIIQMMFHWRTFCSIKTDQKDHFLNDITHTTWYTVHISPNYISFNIFGPYIKIKSIKAYEWLCLTYTSSEWADYEEVDQVSDAIK